MDSDISTEKNVFAPGNWILPKKVLLHLSVPPNVLPMMVGDHISVIHHYKVDHVDDESANGTDALHR